MGRLTKKKNDLNILLIEIGESGYHLASTRSREWLTSVLRGMGEMDFTASSDVRLIMDFFRFGNIIEGRGNLVTTVETTCVRCLEHFTLPLKVKFHYSFYPAEEMEYLPEMEVNREDLDVLPYTGSVLDLVPLIGEQIIVNMPAYPLCSESCKGICQKCGANLNYLSCQCDQEQRGYSAFDVLKDFPFKQKQ